MQECAGANGVTGADEKVRSTGVEGKGEGGRLVHGKDEGRQKQA